MEFETYVKWLFADDCPAEGLELQFVELKPYEGNKGQVIYLLGRVGEFVGDLRCFPSAIANMKELIAKLGKDSTSWSGKMLKFTPIKDKKKFLVTPL